MDELAWQIALNCASLAVTALFGAWALIPAYRALRYPARVTYVHRSYLPFFGSAVQSVPDLLVTVDGQPISESVLLLLGAFVCDGAKDITSDMVVRPLTLRLKEGWRWLAVGKIEASPGVTAGVVIERFPTDCLVVDFGPLFRCGEYIAFTAFIELDPSDSRPWFWWWGRVVTCYHRINETHIGRASAPDRSFAPTLGLFAGLLPIFAYLGLLGLATLRNALPLELSLATWALFFLLNLGFHLARLRLARLLPPHLLQESTF